MGIKIVAIYDNEGITKDRYTVVLDQKNTATTTLCLCMSDSPNSPQGISMFGGCIDGLHLGDKINFMDLPKVIQEHITKRLA